jgi:hypothetical protein
MPNRTVNVTVETGEEVVFHRRTRRTDTKMPFLMLGNGQTNRNGTSVDFLMTMLELHQAPRKLMLQMVEVRSVDSNLVTHEALMGTLGMNKRIIDNHMPALIDIGLVRRVKRGLYLINPLAVLPPNGIAAREMWDKLSILEQRTEETAAPTPVTG